MNQENQSVLVQKSKECSHEKHNDQDYECHGHHHGRKKDLLLFVLGLAAYIAALFINHEWISILLNISAIALAGHHIIVEGIKDTAIQSFKQKKLIPNIHLLMTVAAAGALIIQEYREAALLILIFAGAHFLEEYAEGKSKKEITSLLEMNPTTARRIQKDGLIEIVEVSALNIGDRLQVLNGDQVPTDGRIVSGQTIIDESTVTGESIPVEKEIGDEVFGSTQNGNDTFTMEVTKDSSETVFAKIVQLVSQAQSDISKTAAFIKKIEPVYVKIVFLLAPVFYLSGLFIFNWGQTVSFYRTMVFLIGASPCALAATDIPATLSAISNLAKKGVLFKGGSYLSNLSDLKAIAFDKTGTLTMGEPVVTDVFFENTVTEKKQEKYLDILVEMEKKSNHPLAEAIITHFGNRATLNLEPENRVGVGLTAYYQDSVYQVGKPSSYEIVSDEIVKQTEEFESNGKTVIYFGTNKKVYGLIAVQDIPKETAKEAIAYFQENHIHTVMLTGDAERTGNAIGRLLNIDEVEGNVLPENKSTIISNLKKKYGVTAMLGDGVNDAPALVSADIGVAMGEGTDIAIDVADAVLMKNDLNKFSYTHQLSKKLRKIVWQNIIFAMIVVLFLTVMNIIGRMDMGFAVFIHEGSTLVVILNGLRLLRELAVNYLKE